METDENIIININESKHLLIDNNKVVDKNVVIDIINNTENSVTEIDKNEFIEKYIIIKKSYLLVFTILLILILFAILLSILIIPNLSSNDDFIKNYYKNGFFALINNLNTKNITL
ncbi:hypothetical protein TCON_1636 [Astathelohania contejeani]|uniref:Uncharacterized protein n=1 Tax=Astathelohania contejeani TaxID=164912 RepID=A0ABQ7HYB1_9MICR|nr:hypothetical protein TCON_1636 [Thelohania contejeani]